MIQIHITTIRVSWIEHRTNQPMADELRVTSGTLLNFIKKAKIKFFQTCIYKKTTNTGKMNTIVGGKVEYQRNRGRPNISRENDVEDWMGKSVWRLETNSRRSADVGLYI